MSRQEQQPQSLSACELRALLMREIDVARQTLDNRQLEPSPELRAQYQLLETLLEHVDSNLLADAFDDMDLRPSSSSSSCAV